MAQLLDAEGVEHDHVIQPVQELRLERGIDHVHDRLVPCGQIHLLVDQELAAQVGGQDQDRVAEVHGASLPVGQPPVIEHLQQDVEHFRVRLLDLVEQDHRVGPAAHRFGKLAALLVADVARRGTDQPGHRMLLRVLGHVDAHHGPGVIEQEVRQRLGQLGLAHAGGAQEQERTGGPVRVRDSGAGTAYRIGDGGHRLGLADQPLADHLFHVQQLLAFTLQHPPGRDPGPGRDHLGDVIGGDLLGHHQLPVRVAGLGGGGRVQLLLQRRDLPVEQPRGLLQVALALILLRLAAQLVKLGLQVTDPVQPGLLRLPAGVQRVKLLLLVRHVLTQRLQTLHRGRVGLRGQGQLLHGQPVHLTAQLVDLLGGRVDLHAQPAGGLVDQVDGLVRQLASGDVAVGQGGGGHQGTVGDGNLVVRLVAFLQPTQDRDGVINARLAHVHLGEAAFQGRVLLNVLAVLIQRGGADQAQFPAGEHRLEHVPGVHRAFRGTGTHDGVDLVNEGHDLPVGGLDLLQDGLQALLKLTAVLRAGHHGTQVQGNQGLAAQRFGYVPGDHALGQALHHGGLADARVTDEHRVVLGAPRKHLHHTPDFLVAPDHRVELAGAGQCGHVGTELLQRLERAFRIRTVDLAVPADGGQGGAEQFARRSDLAHRFPGLGDIRGQSDEQVFGGDIGVPQFTGQFLGRVDSLQQLARELGLRHGGARAGGQGLDDRAGLDREPIDVDACGLQQRHGHRVTLVKQRLEQVRRFNLRVARGRGIHPGRGESLLALGGEFGVHSSPSSQTYTS